MKEAQIKVVFVSYDNVSVRIIDNELHALQEAVGGYIEVAPFDRYDLVCDEEGKLKGKRPTLFMDYDVIVGECFITKSDDEGNFTSLSDEDINFIMKLLE